MPGQHITDNILIVQELIHKFKVSKGHKRLFAWKIDLSKAYDRMSWRFIEHILGEIGWPLNLIQLIMSCTTFISYQVCVNGELTSSFRPQNSIRQGEPFSHYLFVLCIEKLSHIIFDIVRQNKWKPMKSSQSSPAVCHLFFADDLILFSKASPKRARVVNHYLEMFCQALSQLLILRNLLFFCSPNTCGESTHEISSICSSPLT